MSTDTTTEKNMSTSTSSNKNEPIKTRPPTRFAKKSTGTPEPATRVGPTKRLAALATKDKLMENFNPDLSNREKRKLERKLKTKVMPGISYDSYGYHIATGINLCDCLDSSCPGCFFPCKKCASLKCGPDCRNCRKIIYESVEFHGFSYVKQNPLEK